MDTMIDSDKQRTSSDLETNAGIFVESTAKPDILRIGLVKGFLAKATTPATKNCFLIDK
ncbi:MAG: hypothetical protein AAFP90_21615 [Planctomycetota bacterium]